MFDKLEDILERFEVVLQQLNDPDVVNDQEKFRKLMKEQTDLAPIVEAYKEYKEANQSIEDSLVMLEEESDEELKELVKEELADPFWSRWRRSCPICSGNLPHVCTLCRKPKMAGRNHGI